MPKINYNKNQQQQQEFKIELPPMTNHGFVVGMCRTLQQGMSGFVKYNVVSSETKDGKTSITLTGQASKDMFDIISIPLSFEIQNSVMTVKKMLEILDIKTAYFSETGKFSTMISVVGDKKVELKKKITDYIKKYLFECPPIMVKIILEKNPDIKPTNVIGCGGNTLVYFEDDASYDQFFQFFQMIPDFIQFIPYDGKAHNKDIILRICNEQNPSHRACHSVNPNKNGGMITLLAIEKVEDIKANIEAEIAKLDMTASTELIDSLLEDDIVDSA